MTATLGTHLAAGVAMENAIQILGSYIITFVVIGSLAWSVLRRGRQLAEQVDDDDKYWT